MIQHRCEGSGQKPVGEPIVVTRDRSNWGGHQVTLGECPVCGGKIGLVKHIGTLRAHVNMPLRQQAIAQGWRRWQA